MNKNPKTLPQAIKIIVSKYGKDIVNDVRMVNIISDEITLEDSTAVKSILRDVIKKGYGNKISAISATKEDFHLKIKAFSKNISDSMGYKNAIVQYTLYSIAYGIGICPQEPYLKNQNNPTPPQKTVEGTLEIVEKKPPYKTMIVFAVIAVISGFYGLNYWASSSDREQFENKVFSGNSLMSSGNYDQAVERYKDAYNDYNAMSRSSYQKEALEKIDAVVDKLIKEGETNNKSLVQAYKVIESELQLTLSDADKERLTTKRIDLENKITERTDNGRNSLIINLSANNGKLDDNGKKLLGELLELSPNDYWLNFIKEKSYE